MKAKLAGVHAYVKQSHGRALKFHEKMTLGKIKKKSATGCSKSWKTHPSMLEQMTERLKHISVRIMQELEYSILFNCSLVSQKCLNANKPPRALTSFNRKLLGFSQISKKQSLKDKLSELISSQTLKEIKNK